MSDQKKANPAFAQGLDQLSLQHQKQRYLDLLNRHAPTAIAIFDCNMHYLSASARWISDYHIQGEVLGQSHYQAVNNLCGICKDYHDRALAGETITTDNFLLEMPDGDTRWLRMEMEPWYQDNGAIGGIVIFSEDNTRQKNAELAAEISRSKLLAALSSMNDAVYIANEQGQLVDFNEAFVSYHGFKSKAECPDKISDYSAILEKIGADGKIIPWAQWPVFRAMRGETATGVEYKLRHKDSGQTWIGSYSFAPLRNSDGLIIGALVSARDVTEQHQMGQENHAKRLELEEAHRHLVVRQTAAAIAHELNQPLNAIVNYTNVALQILETGCHNSQSLAYALTQAEQQAQRAGRAMHELMALLCKNQSVTESLNIAAIMADAVDFVIGNNAHGRPVFLIWQIAPGLAPVQGNRLQIQKVVVNLIANAIQAMQGMAPEQATLILSAQTLPGDSTLQHVRVSDTGPGLSQAQAEEVFQPFFSTKASGLGMGLAISRTIIEAHGGKLWVESSPGAGAHFHFTLPIAQLI